jgi:hypothetical protein
LNRFYQKSDENNLYFVEKRRGEERRGEIAGTFRNYQLLNNSRFKAILKRGEGGMKFLDS